jgi:hypothetical protein
VYLVCVCVCVFAFDLFIVFFVFILVPHHKSRESGKIRPHPRGHPSSKSLFQKFSDAYVGQTKESNREESSPSIQDDRNMCQQLHLVKPFHPRAIRIDMLQSHHKTQKPHRRKGS